MPKVAKFVTVPDVDAFLDGEISPDRANVVRVCINRSPATASFSANRAAVIELLYSGRDAIYKDDPELKAVMERLLAG